MKKITYKAYDSYITRVVNKNLKENGRSTASCTISDNCKVIRETRPEEKILLVVDNWKEIIKAFK